MTNSTPPTFPEFVAFLRPFTGLKEDFPIKPSTLFEDDLGITGDDGVDLMAAVEQEYGISLESARELLSMKPNEYLFNAEGGGLIDFQELKRVTRNLFSSTKEPRPVVLSFRVGQLYDIVYQLVALKA